MQRLPPPAASQQLPFLPTTLTLAHLPLMQAHHLTGTSHHPVSVISISQSVSQSLSSSLPICSASTSLMPSLPHVPLHIGHRTVLPPTTSASHAVVLPVSTAILSVTSKSPTVSFVGSNPAGHSSVSPLRSDLLDSHLKSTQQYLYSQAPYSVGPPGSTNTNNQSLNSSLVAGASGNNSIAGHNTASINNSSSVSQYANPNLVSLLSSPSLVQQISVTLPQLGSVGQLPSTTTVTKVSANVSVLSTDQQNKSIHNIGSNKIASIVTSTNSNCGIVSNPISSASPNSGNAPNGSVFMPSLGLGGAIILSTPSTTILVPPRPPIGAPPSLAEITDRLQMPPPSLPPPSALRRAAKSANVAATASSGLGQAIEIELSPAAVRQNCSSSTLALSASSPSSSDSSSSNLSSALLPSASVTSPLSVSGLTTGLLSTPIESISRDISTTKPLAIIPAILASSSAHTTPSDCPIITNGTAAWSDQFLCERRIFSSKTVNADDNETDCIEEDEDENKQHPLLGDFQGNSKRYYPYLLLSFNVT
ncbi:unnamed protein product [Protopolystoma xenopodis]|uniref:Uncharacterized protein n=1 Tax=Protopolystoma xenopodis TaxID=117903 RepID=A0A3S5BSQ7_9PLAT|nr:unnamed protein product [Protopolystoma xenopodis]